MNHTFVTFRDTLTQLQDTLTLCNDMTLILRCTAQERSLICKRCEKNINDNDALTRALERQSFDLGNKTRTLVASMLELGMKHERIPVSDHDAWTVFCTSTNKVDVTKLATCIKNLSATVELKRLDILGKETGGMTDVDASSSYSDYTDSDTESTDEEGKSFEDRRNRRNMYHTSDDDASGSEHEEDATTYTSSTQTSSVSR